MHIVMHIVSYIVRYIVVRDIGQVNICQVHRQVYR